MGKRAEMSEVRATAVLQATADLLDEEASPLSRCVRWPSGPESPRAASSCTPQNKADLVNQVYGLRIAARWHDLLDALADEAATGSGREVLPRLRRHLLRRSANVQAFYKELGSQERARLPIVDQINERVSEALAQAARLGAIRPGVDLEALDFSYQALYSNVIRLANTGFDQRRARRIIAESLSQLRFGVSV